MKGPQLLELVHVYCKTHAKDISRALGREGSNAKGSRASLRQGYTEAGHLDVLGKD